jgi:pimeloyl-ACP methyl ester carboxylesterase
LGRFTASDGVAIHYEEVGAGRPLLLLHGLMAHAGFWRGQLPLADSFRLIAPDLRGHGRSPAPPASVTVDRLVGDVAELVDALGLADAVVVGWSLGAALGWPLLAGPMGDRFAASVVVDMTPCIRNSGGWQLGLSPELIEARAAAFRDDFASFAAAAGRPCSARRSRTARPSSPPGPRRNSPATTRPPWPRSGTRSPRRIIGRCCRGSRSRR